MINKENCILLGTLAKPHGVRGLIQLRFSGLKAEDIREKGLVFVEIDGLPVPFFIENFLEKTNDLAILKIEGIDSETRAREFAGYPVYVMKNQVKRKKASIREIPDLEGYRVIDYKLGFVGYASEIVSLSANSLLRIVNQGREYLVPIHEEIIREIDDTDRVIRLESPEGLFDL